jgi:hypothetical protein
LQNADAILTLFAMGSQGCGSVWDCGIVRAAEEGDCLRIQSEQTQFKRIAGCDLGDETALAAVLEKSAHRQRKIPVEMRARDTIEIRKTGNGPKERAAAGDSNETRRAGGQTLDRVGSEMELFDIDAGSEGFEHGR